MEQTNTNVGGSLPALALALLAAACGSATTTTESTGEAPAQGAEVTVDGKGAELECPAAANECPAACKSLLVRPVVKTVDGMCLGALKTIGCFSPPDDPPGDKVDCAVAADESHLFMGDMVASGHLKLEHGYQDCGGDYSRWEELGP